MMIGGLLSSHKQMHGEAGGHCVDDISNKEVKQHTHTQILSVWLLLFLKD